MTRPVETAASGQPLSSRQRWVWRASANHPALRVAGTLRVEHSLSVEQAVAALRRVAGRHAILRTAFLPQAGQRYPLQVPLANAADALRWNVVETATGRGLAAEEAAFAPQKGRPMRAILHRSGTQVDRIEISLPAICADSESLDIVAEEVAEFLIHPDQESVPPAYQYCDVATWLNRLDEQATAADRAFWRERCGESPRLPFELVAPIAVAGTRRSIPLCLSPGQTGAMAARCHERGWTLEALCLAAWYAWMRRMGIARPACAVRLPGRGYEDVQQVVGPLARRPVLAQPGTAGGGFADLVVACGRLLDDAHARTESLDDSSKPDSPPTPGYSFCTVRSEPLRAAGLRWIERRDLSDPLSVELAVHVGEIEAALWTAQLCYDPAWVTPAAAEAAAATFVPFLERLVEQPDERPARIAVPGEPVRGRQRVAEAGLRTVVELFQEQAKRVPERIALVAQDGRISYRELDDMSSRMARWLIARGLRAQDAVAVDAVRTTQLVAALLGAWKAGLVVLPLDPQTPPLRRQALVEQVRPRYYIQCNPGDDAAADTLSLKLPHTSPTTDAAPAPAVPANACCFYMATSGTSGRPKIVSVEHVNLAAYARGFLASVDLPDGARFASVSTLAADLGHTAVFGALCSGGELHLIPKRLWLDRQGVAAYMERHRIDVLKLVPSHLEALLEGEGSARLLPRRLLVLGGEAPRHDLLESLRRKAPGLSVLNHYGPTETTVGVCALRVDRPAEPVPVGSPGLGRPFEGVGLYLLDDDLHPVPTWFEGEIWIGGATVARGYLGDPAMTAQRFLPDPYSPERGTRMYRTGDRARRRLDGSYEFLGRVDRQHKVAGHRIDLSEVEAALKAHPAVHRAVVVADPAAYPPQLIAYVVPADGQAPSSEGLRGHLQARLPLPVLPGAYRLVQRIPLTANGKPDLRRLMGEGQPLAARAAIAPENRLEALVLAIWAKVLEIDRVGADDNFFDIGGHSLHLIRIHRRLEQELSRRIDIVQLFRFATPRSLARFLAEQAPGKELDDATARGRLQRASTGSGRSRPKGARK